MLKFAMKRAAILSVLFFVAGQVSAQSVAPNITTHRQGAGTLNDEGWVEATSTMGGYSLKLPGKFNDMTMAQQSPKSAVEKAEVLTTTTVQRIHFTATRMFFRQGKAGAEKQFNAMKAAQGKGRYKVMRPMSMSGRAALEAEIETKNTVAVQRVVLLDEDLFTMIVEFPKTQETVARRLAPTFFDSVSFQ